jgi:hypothetical protein
VGRRQISNSLSVFTTQQNGRDDFVAAVLLLIQIAIAYEQRDGIRRRHGGRFDLHRRGIETRAMKPQAKSAHRRSRSRRGGPHLWCGQSLQTVAELWNEKRAGTSEVHRTFASFNMGFSNSHDFTD